MLRTQMMKMTTTNQKMIVKQERNLKKAKATNALKNNLLVTKSSLQKTAKRSQINQNLRQMKMLQSKRVMTRKRKKRQIQLKLLKRKKRSKRSR